MSSLNNLYNYTKAITFTVLEKTFNYYLKSVLEYLNILCCVIRDVTCELKKMFLTQDSEVILSSMNSVNVWILTVVILFLQGK